MTKLKEKDVEAAVLGVKEGKDADLIRRLFRLSGKELVNVLSRPDMRLFSVIRRLFYLVRMDWKFYGALFICQPSKQS